MLTSPKLTRHAQRVESALSGIVSTSDMPPAIRSSWERCIETHALDPSARKQPIVVDRPELQARREQHALLLSIARVELLNLRRRLQHNDFGIMLTDQDGVILHYVGDPGFAAIARRSGLREGAVWSEAELGTNGMGTCIVEQRAVLIHQNDHFLAQNTELTCSAAPIFDAQGRVIAALDISGAATRAQAHTLALVEIAAQNIENRTLLEGFRQTHVLRFHRQPEFIYTPGEGIVAFDDAGTIVGGNRSALELLGFEHHRELCGQPLAQVFETTANAQFQLAGRRAFRPAPLLSRASQSRLWSAIQPPDRDARSGRTVAVAADLAPSGPLAMLEHGDATMAANIRTVRRVLDRDIPILLLGETGTGKGCFAKAIHNASARADKPFITVNCAAIPETLIESELFGYKAGAFTGATREGHPGRVVQANGGTLFLDEIGDMPLPLQVRLLSVIEDREVIPLGGSKPIPVDIRLISATHCDLDTLVRERRFREDLYYRLNGLPLRLPALRERQDLRALIHALVRVEAGDQAPGLQIDDDAVDRLMRASWPGNIRQLRNVLRTAIALSDGECLTTADLSPEALRAAPPVSTPGAVTVASSDPVDADDDVLGQAESGALRRVLESCRWNVSAAAARLGVSRKTLYRKMLRHGITRLEGLGGDSRAEARRWAAIDDSADPCPMIRHPD